MIPIMKRAALAFLLLGLPSIASAQDTGQPSPPAPQQTEPAPPSRSPQQQPQEGSGSSLSNQLSRSHGVLKPLPTGDTDVLPPPSAGPGSTPVIPPPGAPGNGSGEVQPK